MTARACHHSRRVRRHTHDSHRARRRTTLRRSLQHNGVDNICTVLQAYMMILCNGDLRNTICRLETMSCARRAKSVTGAVPSLIRGVWVDERGWSGRNFGAGNLRLKLFKAQKIVYILAEIEFMKFLFLSGAPQGRFRGLRDP